MIQLFRQTSFVLHIGNIKMQRALQVMRQVDWSHASFMAIAGAINTQAVTPWHAYCFLWKTELFKNKDPLKCFIQCWCKIQQQLAMIVTGKDGLERTILERGVSTVTVPFPQ